ncbi:MAG: ABC transporter permease [Bacteroidota bacterium]
MLRHHFIIIIRNFQRNKTTFLINLIGLSTGLACTLLIYLWVMDELQTDRFNEKDAQLFQVMKHSKAPNGGINTFPWTPPPLAKALVEELPEVEMAVATILRGTDLKGILKAGEQQLKVREQYAGADYFKMFDYPLIAGTKEQVLADKYSVVLSEQLAQSLFGTTDQIIGKSVEWDKAPFAGTYLVSGVFSAPKSNVSQQFDLVFSFEHFIDQFPETNKWTYGGPDTYVLLHPDTDPSAFNEKISGYLQEKSEEDYQHLFIRPFADRYLYDHYESGQQVGGRISYVWLFSIIAFFILLIACINFMNLSTAQANKKLKEVGVKKAIGASRGTLMTQYLSESLFIAFLALMVAIVLVEMILSPFNAVVDKQLALDIDGQLLLVGLGTMLFTGILAGSYPAFYLSKFKPAKVLKGQIEHSLGAIWARKGLVVFQFMVSVILIVSVMVVYSQIQYIHSKHLGFEKDQVITFKREGILNDHLVPFIDAAKQLPGIQQISGIRSDLLNNQTNTRGVSWPGRPEDFRIAFKYLMVDFNFIDAMGIELTAGRAYSQDYGEESDKIIFNETAIQQMGLKDPIGKTVRQWGRDKQIIGVVKDFHFESLYEDVKPCFISLTDKTINLVARIATGQEEESLAALEGLYEKMNNGIPLEYQFLDETYQQFYQSEQNVATISRYFAGMAILISCLGLFGLAAFNTERRQKEIGVRKILGASVAGIVYLLSKDFTRLVGLGILMALPLSYLLVQYWLDSFAFRIDFSPLFLLGAGSLALLIAWLTVAFQTFRAAQINPVECLKAE